MTKAKEFQSDLLKAFSSAHRVSVIEHSWPCDFFDEQGQLIEDPPRLEYERVELTPARRARFEVAFERMPDDPKTAFSLCLFAPHHTIELVDEAGGKSLIRICFKCDDTEWDGRPVVTPEAFQQVLRSLIEPLGFQASRNWRELAKDRALGLTTKR